MPECRVHTSRHHMLKHHLNLAHTLTLNPYPKLYSTKVSRRQAAITNTDLLLAKVAGNEAIEAGNYSQYRLGLMLHVQESVAIPGSRSGKSHHLLQNRGEAGIERLTLTKRQLEG
ncbi:hypothetical protein RRG08_024350 [Elysia crispata]|uniref:Uncharacterized protein n=1 Tax=Elysia crispata TaxID=231223 RepID=A0AAE1DHZ7_9GAST|nr:hypothetical protein RRG08_024350 [Elysia crispata]